MASSIPQMRSEYLEIGRAEKPTVQQKERYKELALRIMEAAKVLKKEEITVYHHVFDDRDEDHFSFYCGEKKGQTRLIPISAKEAGILNFQMDQPEGCTWPLLNPETNEFFVPVCKRETVQPPNIFKRRTYDYLIEGIETAQSDKDSKEYRILQALQPYAKAMLDCVGRFRYNNVVQLFPEYPNGESLR